jgi:hypothetical protein
MLRNFSISLFTIAPQDTNWEGDSCDTRTGLLPAFAIRSVAGWSWSLPLLSSCWRCAGSWNGEAAIVELNITILPQSRGASEERERGCKLVGPFNGRSHWAGKAEHGFHKA